MESTTTILNKLASNIHLKTLEDGTTRGAFDRLTKKDFRTEEAFNEYKLALCYAVFHIGKSLAASTDGASDEQRNKALTWIVKAYDVLKAEIRVQSACPAELENAKVLKKHVRAWIATGAFAALKTNYATAEREIKIKSTATLQRFVESDFSDILNGRERLSRVVGNNQAETFIAKQTAPKEEAKPAEPAKAEQPAEKPAEPAKKPAKSK